MVVRKGPNLGALLTFLLGTCLLVLSSCATSTLVMPTKTATPLEAEPHLVEIPTRLPALTPTEAPAVGTPEIPEPTPETVVTVEADPLIYSILPEKSEARFYIDEVLLGEPKTVVGRTRDLTGDILVDLAHPDRAELGVVTVNALDLTTDNSFRNRALRQQILESNREEYRYITFAPLALQGLPDVVVIGEAVEFQVLGELTIRDVTREVTFVMSVTPVSATEISGSGEALVRREDFNLVIPQVTGVAQVSETVRLEIDFVAFAPEQGEGGV